MLKNTILIISICAMGNALFAQKNTVIDSIIAADSSIIMYEDNPIIKAMDDILMYKFALCHDGDSCTGMAYDPKNEIVNDSLIQMRLAEMDSKSPMFFPYNGSTRAYINLYVNRRKTLTARMLGLGDLYFPMFEQALVKHGLPMELKYLPIVESALNPKAESWAGAGGLWQFMVATGNIYDLDVTSYIDKRKDPYLATDAACRYLKFLHSMYKDWSLALAAYNAGPGNVNKAIRRSGKDADYWLVQSYLPKETQGYVPAFIAVNYAMTYYEEHDICPRAGKIKYNEIDTVLISKKMDLNILSSMLDMEIEKLEYLNPIYRTSIIPDLEENLPLYLPIDKIGMFITNEAMVYEKSAEVDAILQANQELANKAPNGSQYYYVKRGDYLGKIANKFSCSVTEIKSWNKMKSNRLSPGQKLLIKRGKKGDKPSSSTSTKNVAENKTKTTTKKPVGRGSVYTVKSGDSLWGIAQKNGTTVDNIKALNPGLSHKNLKVGSKINL